MDVPRVYLPQSLFVLSQWQEMVVQPYAAGADWWEVEGELPQGFVFDYASGRIYGNGLLPGVWDVVIYAHNDAGRSLGRDVTFAVYGHGPKALMVTNLYIDLSTWQVRSVAVPPQGQAAQGGPVIEVMYRDKISFLLEFVNKPDGGPALIDVEDIAFSIKGLDTEPAFFVVGDNAFIKRTDGRCELEFSFAGQEFLSYLDDVETDDGTTRDCLCEFQIFTKRFGDERIENIYTTQPFVAKLTRDIMMR